MNTDILAVSGVISVVVALFLSGASLGLEHKKLEGFFHIAAIILGFLGPILMAAAFVIDCERIFR